MRILIISENKFVGKKLAKRLIKESHDVSVLNKKGTAPKGASKLKFNRNKKE